MSRLVAEAERETIAFRDRADRSLQRCCSPRRARSPRRRNRRDLYVERAVGPNQRQVRLLSGTSRLMTDWNDPDHSPRRQEQRRAREGIDGSQAYGGESVTGTSGNACREPRADGRVSPDPPASHAAFGFLLRSDFRSIIPFFRRYLHEHFGSSRFSPHQDVSERITRSDGPR